MVPWRETAPCTIPNLNLRTPLQWALKDLEWNPKFCAIYGIVISPICFTIIFSVSQISLIPNFLKALSLPKFVSTLPPFKVV